VGAVFNRDTIKILYQIEKAAFVCIRLLFERGRRN